MNQFTELFEEKFAVRQSYVKNLEAFRLVNKDETNWEIAVDMYGIANAVVHLFREIDDEDLHMIKEGLKKAFGTKKVFFKNRTKNKSWDLPIEKSDLIQVTENNHKFIINLVDYVDMGLFLDHRETRKKIEKLAQGKVFLNLFAYTGSFTVYAAAGRAIKTHTVDLSKTYCEWARNNLDLNGLKPEDNWVYKMDSLEFLRYAKRKNLVFDLMVIDPPTFSKNKTESWSVQRDHYELLKAAHELLSPNGEIFFSNNFTGFIMDRKLNELFKIKDITAESIPLDFKFTFEVGTPIHTCFLLKKLN